MVHIVSAVTEHGSLMHCIAGPKTILWMRTAWHICISIICGCHKYGLMELSVCAIAYKLRLELGCSWTLLADSAGHICMQVEDRTSIAGWVLTGEWVRKEDFYFIFTNSVSTNYPCSQKKLVTDQQPYQCFHYCKEPQIQNACKSCVAWCECV